MNLLLMRHGTAELASDDFNRSLTESGIRGVRQTAKSLVKGLVDMNQGMPSKIYASPLRRSQETAQILLDELNLYSSNLNVDVETLGLIRPESQIEDFIEFLRDKGDEELCIYVSHQPFVGILMYYLTRIDTFMDTADLNCVSIRSYSQGGGELKWKISA